MSTEQRVFKDAADMQVGIFQAWIGEGSHNNHLVIHDGTDRVFVEADEARALYEWLGKVLP